MIGWLFMAGLLPALVACRGFDEAEEDWVLAVGSRRVAEKELLRDMADASPGVDPSAYAGSDMWDRLLERLIDRYMVLEYAADSGITVEQTELDRALRRYSGHADRDSLRKALLKEYISEEEWRSRIREHLLFDKVLARITAKVSPPSYEEIKAHYAANRQDYHTPEMLRFRQIVTRNREEAERVLQRLQTGEDMEEMARAFSVAAEAEQGGLVDWIARKDLPESMEEALLRLSSGKRSGVIETPYGFHIFQLLDHRPGEDRTLPEVYDAIESELLYRKRQMYWTQWLRELRGRFEVRIHTENLKKMGVS